jgi:hypothetical protein
MALHFGKIPIELDVEQVQEYLFLLQKRSKTPLCVSPRLRSIIIASMS